MPKTKVPLKRINAIIGYAISNGMIHIDLNTITHQIASAENLTYSNPNLFLMSGYLKDKEIYSKSFRFKLNGNSVNISLDLDKLNEKVGVDSKNYDLEESLVKYYGEVFKRTYKTECLEALMNSTVPSGASSTSSPRYKMRELISKFRMLKLSKDDIPKYIDWVFKEKNKIVINLSLLKSDTIIQNWYVNKNKEKGTNAKQISSKWEQRSN